MKRENCTKCESCQKDAVYACSVCRKLLCGEHIRLQTACDSCIKKPTTSKFRITKVKSDNERKRIRDFVKRLWGEEEQITFNKKLKVDELPTYVSKVKQETAGFVSFTELNDAMLIAALGVVPRFQGMGIGRSLVEKVEAKARELHKSRVLVSTSNDDLPALAFYQSLGFQIFEVNPNIIAEKHGTVLTGIAGLPIRDELRLKKTLL